MFKSAKRKNNRGFTVYEILIVVVIIGIIAAFAIPGLISAHRSMRLMELDNSARSIFMAAQNRLTAMQGAGEDLKDLSDIPVNEHKDPHTGAGVYFALIKGDSRTLKLDDLVPAGSIDTELYNNNYVVEIDPKTGAGRSMPCGIGRRLNLPMKAMHTTR